MSFLQPFPGVGRDTYGYGNYDTSVCFFGDAGPSLLCPSFSRFLVSAGIHTAGTEITIASVSAMVRKLASVKVVVIVPHPSRNKLV